MTELAASTRQVFKRVLFSESDKRLIDGARAKLQRAFSQFQVGHGVGARYPSCWVSDSFLQLANSIAVSQELRQMGTGIVSATTNLEQVDSGVTQIINQLGPHLVLVATELPGMGSRVAHMVSSMDQVTASTVQNTLSIHQINSGVQQEQKKD